ncbi:MAG: histidine phosphatase family protein [Rubrimonas sp.]|uniref:histidine phosphatase family protein n=1 Tax=Rubrimonas sp. TaxID=2036015 RepID=UPI002FDE92A8
MHGAAIALLRHFPTDWNEEGRLQGRVDRPLTDAARDALRRFRPPPPWDAAEIVASPLSRAADTARALWPDAPNRVDPRLVELDMGAWEGRRGADLLADPASGFRPVSEWGWDGGPPGGESPRAAFARVAPLLAEIARAGRATVLVAHRGLMRAILAVAWGWDYDRPEPFAIKRARLHPLRLDAGGAPVAPDPPIRLIPR